MRNIILFFFCSILALTTGVEIKAQSTMPIIAYYGPVIENMTKSEYQVMKDCGFTHTLNIYNTVDDALKDLVTANTVGMKVYVHTPALLNNTAATVRQIKNSQALVGYFLADEPKIGDIKKYANIAKTVKGLDSGHSCYVNLNPYYSEGQMKSMGAQTYKTYMQRASQIGLPQISFDFYPVTKDGLRSETWFYTLKKIREESLRTGKPFWGYVLSVPHNDYPQPTLAMLRLQCYVNLAYGAQAIQYFTYKTPNDKTYSFHNAPIEKNGKKTATYALVKQMNKELKTVSSLFYRANIEQIGHLVVIPSDCQKPQMPNGLKLLKVKGRAGAVVSVFNNNGHKYMCVVNKDYTESMTLTIGVNSKTVRYISKQLVESKPKTSYIVLPGDVALFKLQ